MLTSGSLVLLANSMTDLLLVFSSRGNMLSSASFAVLFSNTIPMKMHSYAILTECVDLLN